jgi:hypothetical protein
MGWNRCEYGFEFAEKIEIIVEMYGFRGLIETAEADMKLLVALN